MLTFLRIITRSIAVVACAVAGDIFVAYGMMSFGFSFIEIIGDLMLVEAAILFLVAGLVDFASSIGAAQFRKTILGSKEDYSQLAHKEAERQAAVLVLAGVVLFVTLLSIALLAHV